MTTRSFLKRLHALIRYRQALKHMEQYPDATAEELGREDTCIICREEMRPWDPADSSHVERSRAKRLPCGHILHFGCLKSWLERQQVCPTCRRPVARDGQQPAANGGAGVLGLFPAGQNRPLQPPANGQAAPGGGQPAQGGPANNIPNPNVRMFNLGPIRLGFAQGGADEIREMAQRMRAPPDAVNPPIPTPTVPTPQENDMGSNPGLDQLRGQLLALSQQVRQEMINTHNAAHEVQVLSLLMNEITRLRQLQQQQPQGQQQPTQPTPPAALGALLGGQPHLPQHQQQGLIHPFMHLPMQGPLQVPNSPHLVAARHPPSITRHVGTGYGAAIPAGSSELPDGVVIPPGWSLLPLQRLDGEAQPSEPAQHAQGVAQDMLRSVFAHHPRSRGTSPAPSSTLSTQLGRAAAPTSSIPEASRRPGSQGGTTSDTAARRQPPVAAPIPLTPNWGGPAQLFGGDRAPAPMFGYQVEPRQGLHGGEPGESSGDGSTANAPTVVNGVASGERGGDQRTEGAAEVNGSAGDRRPRPVTVEEADDAEDER